MMLVWPVAVVCPPPVSSAAFSGVSVRLPARLLVKTAFSGGFPARSCPPRDSLDDRPTLGQPTKGLPSVSTLFTKLNKVHDEIRISGFSWGGGRTRRVRG